MGIIPGVVGALLGALGSSGVPLACSYLSRATSSTDGTSYSFGSYGIGTAATDRYILVVVYNTTNADTTSGFQAVPSGVTVAGIAASSVGPIGVVAGSAGFSVVSYWLAAVPTGTTGTIAVGFSISQKNCAIDAYGITGSANGPTLVASAGNVGSGTTLVVGSVDFVNGGVVIAAAATISNVSFTWTGATERADATSESRGCSSAMDTKTTSGTAALSFTTSGSMAFVAASAISLMAA